MSFFWTKFEISAIVSSVLYKGCFYGRPGRLTDYNSSFYQSTVCSSTIIYDEFRAVVRMGLRRFKAWRNFGGVSKEIDNLLQPPPWIWKPNYGSEYIVCIQSVDYSKSVLSTTAQLLTSLPSIFDGIIALHCKIFYIIWCKGGFSRVKQMTYQLSEESFGPLK